MAFGGDGLKISALARAELWLNTIAAWLRAPVFGYGLGGFDAAYGLVRSSHQSWFPSLATIFTTPTVFAGAAHNELLQALAQFGVYGAALFTAFGWCVLRQPGPLAARVALWAAAGCAVVGFPTQNPATAILIVTALGLVAREAPKRDYRLTLISVIGLTLCVVLASACLSWVGVRSYEAARHMAAFNATAMADPLKAFESNLKAVEALPLLAENRRQLSPSLTRVMQAYRDRLVLDESAADRVFAIALSAGQFDVAALTMRAEYLINVGRADAKDMAELVRRLLVTAANIPSTWLIKAYWHRARAETDEARKAAERGLEVGLRNPILDAQLRGIITETVQ